jgi:TetR/AcrR family transcriptional regulator, mexJK operon transcriptional repressor
MITAEPEIRRGRKYDQVLAGARLVFLRDGYEGASVDDIAREAGVSKATLYAYFPDKRLLFLEVARSECRRQADEAEAQIDDSQPAAQVLTFAAGRIMEHVLSDFGLQMYRIAVTESARFPEIGQAFYESGPMILRASLGNYLRQAMARGELSIADIDLAADQFGELCKAGVLNRMILGVDKKIAKQDLDRVRQGAVAMFMARYAVVH